VSHEEVGEEWVVPPMDERDIRRRYLLKDELWLSMHELGVRNVGGLDSLLGVFIQVIKAQDRTFDLRVCLVGIKQVCE
jgi:hypothetical protein